MTEPHKISINNIKTQKKKISNANSLNLYIVLPVFFPNFLTLNSKGIYGHEVFRFIHQTYSVDPNCWVFNHLPRVLLRKNTLFSNTHSGSDLTQVFKQVELQRQFELPSGTISLSVNCFNLHRTPANLRVDTNSSLNFTVICGCFFQFQIIASEPLPD